MIKYLTPIKWTGCKRTQASIIIDKMPSYIPCYCELFLGSGAVLMELLTNHQDKLNNGNEKSKIIVSDTNPDLIAMWELIKTDPERICKFYETEWNNRNIIDGCVKGEDRSLETIKHRNDTYYDLRARYNLNALNGTPESGMLLMCLLAFDFNGCVRYNSKGLFNVSNMPVTPGMHPDKKKEIIYNCSKLLNKYDVEIHCKSYDKINIPNNSTIYLDPPYKMFLSKTSNNGGIYNSNDFNIEEFSKWCKETINCNLIISFDGGNVGDQFFPINQYAKFSNRTGKSKFLQQNKKINKQIKDIPTSESLYVKKC